MSRHAWTKTLQFLLILSISWSIAAGCLAIVRIWFPSSLLFDQFLLLTLLVFCSNLMWLHKSKSERFSFFNTGSSQAKFFVSATASLLFFSVVQYSVLAVDRSRSLYVFGWVEEGSIQSENGRYVLKVTGNDLVSQIENDAISQRIHEQISRGLMKNSKDNEVELTFFGKGILFISEVLASVFNLDGWHRNSTLKI